MNLLEIEKIIETLLEIKDTHENLKAAEYDALVKSSKLLLKNRYIIAENELVKNLFQDSERKGNQNIFPLSSTIKETRKISEIYNFNLPIDVLEDINKRITDWIASGGEEKDQYIQRQIEYAEQIHNLVKTKESTIY